MAATLLSFAFVAGGCTGVTRDCCEGSSLYEIKGAAFWSAYSSCMVQFYRGQSPDERSGRMVVTYFNGESPLDRCFLASARSVHINHSDARAYLFKMLTSSREQ
jgi:hypothetical protein